MKPTRRLSTPVVSPGTNSSPNPHASDRSALAITPERSTHESIGMMCREASAALTEARITADIKSAGLDWITTLRAPAIKDLLNSGVLQLTLFDTRDMAATTSPDFPGERLVVCRNPDLAAERARKREELLAATETDLAAI